MREIKWGIVGPGNIANEFVNDLSKITAQKHTVVAVVGKSEDSTMEFKRKHQVPYHFYAVENMIKEIPPDCVYVATPHPMHYEACLKLLQARIPVLCEKPMALNESQVSSLINQSISSNTFLMEGFWLRFLPSINKVVELIESGTIGDLISITAGMSYKAPFDPESRYFNAELGGGSLLDLGIYPIYLSYLLLGIPSEIKAIGKIGSTHVDESCSMLLSYSNGLYAMLESSITKRAPLEAHIFGDKGTIKIGENWNEKPREISISLYDGSSYIYKPDWEGKGLHYEVSEVIRCLDEGKTQSENASHETSLQIIKIMDEVRRQINLKYNNYEK